MSRWDDRIDAEREDKYIKQLNIKLQTALLCKINTVTGELSHPLFKNTTLITDFDITIAELEELLDDNIETPLNEMEISIFYNNANAFPKSPEFVGIKGVGQYYFT